MRAAMNDSSNVSPLVNCPYALPCTVVMLYQMAPPTKIKPAMQNQSIARMTFNTSSSNGLSFRFPCLDLLSNTGQVLTQRAAATGSRPPAVVRMKLQCRIIHSLGI